MEAEVELIRRCQAGDARARAEFFRLYNEQIRRWAFVYAGPVAPGGREPQDVAQQVFIDIFTGRAPPHGKSPLAAWLRIVTRNAARKANKMDRAATIQPDAEILRSPTSMRDPLLMDHLEDALARLPEKQREVIVLHEMLDYSGPELAALLGVSEGTVRSRLRSARHALRKTLRRRGFRLEQLKELS
ncbi:MAG: RNA polymerase sigma factor [Deltaproteobacteria bacterium]